MYQYTIQINDNKQILLLTSEGELLPSTEIIRVCAPHKVFAFDGHMGAGKTTFIKQLCEDLHSEDIVNSPTFAIVNVYDYPSADGQRHDIYHFDCYRIKDIREALDFGAEEYLYSDEYCFIEWPEMIEAILPEDTVYIHIQVQEDGTRVLIIDK